ncbi:MAG: J domain-containing protein [Acidobacteria bacterium]|nr:J domain-containing protein [Acidobacteriota bacterium]
MVSYYEILKVSPKASKAEIKSAYRRLARKLHPDKNAGSPEKAEQFAQVAKAYETLGNPKLRADYDRERLRAEFSDNGSGATIFSSENEYAKRWRQMVYERRYNEIIDRMIADERRESVALQKIIFPMVGLFVSTFAVAVFKPTFFMQSPVILKIVMIALFIVGVIHLFSRLRAAFERYTYDENIHDSILEDAEPEAKPYSRAAAVLFIIGGVVLSLGGGLLLGNYLDFFFGAMMPSVYSHNIQPEFIFYPPIVVLFVDLMHAFASKFE